MQKTFMFSILMCVCCLTGCKTRITDFTVISTKNIDLSRGAEFVEGPRRVTGIDKVHIIVIIPTGQANVKEAIDHAIESTPGAIGLLDGVITNKGWYIPYIYGQIWYEVEGTPLIDPKKAVVNTSLSPKP